MGLKYNRFTAFLAAGMIASAAAVSMTADVSAVQIVEENKICCYEGIFLDNEEITAIFDSIRTTPPFEKVTKDFHITTIFMPTEQISDFYGEKVNIHITSYKIGEVVDDDGEITANEGLKACITSDNEELQEYLDSLGKNFHITGAFKDAAKYTEYIDFSDGKPLDLYVEGTFGCYYSDGTISFEA